MDRKIRFQFTRREPNIHVDRQAGGSKHRQMNGSSGTDASDERRQTDR